MPKISFEWKRSVESFPTVLLAPPPPPPGIVGRSPAGQVTCENRPDSFTVFDAIQEQIGQPKILF